MLDIHHPFAPSKAGRWSLCSASVPMSMLFNHRDVSGPDAIRGTELHNQIANVLTGKLPREQADPSVGMALDLSEDLRRGCETVEIEKWLDHIIIHPDVPIPVTGQLDYFGQNTTPTKVVFIDWKFGANPPPAQFNQQLVGYLLGKGFVDWRPGSIHLAIVAPNAIGGAMIDVWQPTVEEVTEVQELMRDKMIEALTRPQFRPSLSACQHCPASGLCPAQAQAVYALEPVSVTIPQPPAMTADEQSRLFLICKYAEKILPKVKGAILERLDAGEALPHIDYAKPRRGRRQWKDDVEASDLIEMMADDQNVDVDEVTNAVMALKSPAQVEKELKALGVKWENLHDYTDQPFNAPSLQISNEMTQAIKHSSETKIPDEIPATLTQKMEK